MSKGDRRLHPDDLEEIRCILDSRDHTTHHLPYAVRQAARFVAGAFVGGACVVAGGACAVTAAEKLRARSSHAPRP